MSRGDIPRDCVAGNVPLNVPIKKTGLETQLPRKPFSILCKNYIVM